MDDIPTWYRLLFDWRYVKKNHGRTFSFLVGASMDEPGSIFDEQTKAREFALELYSQMISCNIQGKSTRMHNGCHVQAPIVTLEQGQPETTMSFDEIWACCGKDIISGNYSVDAGECHPLTGDEIEWINSVIKH